MLLKENHASSCSDRSSDAEDFSADSSPREPGRPRATVTVLLAEEGSASRHQFKTLLAPADDIAVIGRTADCGRVLELAAKLRPDVVVITVRQALSLGLETMRLVLRTRCGSRLLVLVPQCDSAFVRHVVAAGAAGYLTGPDSSPRLARAIREASRETPSSRGHAPTVKFLTHLTEREREALQLIAQGNGNKQIADQMSISIKTVEKHRQNLMDKLAIHETATLTRYAIYAGIAQ
jgi:DNA-binding NarL/FixJ family response regulator